MQGPRRPIVLFPMQTQANNSSPVIEANDATKVFGGSQAVSDLNLSVSAGICFGLLGPNGAGKTTTLRMIYGVSQPTYGKIRVFGMDVGRETRKVRARLGVTLQDNVMMETLSGRDNLLIHGRHHLLPEALITERV
ncbi:MAG: ATP-binding cassette domain-containing protein, partial [Pseudomonadota bacterium]|nr:ATP-binding cassette domain-containing protein [Pseudomonadota bacterium]